MDADGIEPGSTNRESIATSGKSLDHASFLSIDGSNFGGSSFSLSVACSFSLYMKLHLPQNHSFNLKHFFVNNFEEN